MERASSRPADVRLCKKLELKAPVGQPAGNRCTCSRVVLTLEIWSLEILTLEKMEQWNLCHSSQLTWVEGSRGGAVAEAFNVVVHRDRVGTEPVARNLNASKSTQKQIQKDLNSSQGRKLSTAYLHSHSPNFTTMPRHRSTIFLGF